MNKTLLSIIVLIAISECIGQSCLRRLFEDPSKTHLYITAVIFYSIICYLLFLSYRYKGMGLINVLWSGISVLVIVSTGVILFNEKITKLDIFGIFLILSGIYCILIE